MGVTRKPLKKLSLWLALLMNVSFRTFVSNHFLEHLFCVLVLKVEALAVKLTQHEGVLIQEKTEVKKLASFLKQVFPYV